MSALVLLSWESFRSFCESSMTYLLTLPIGLIFSLLGTFQILTYLCPIVYLAFCPMQNLKKKYNTNWALVTGGSSGIGKALCFELAKQDLNIVVAALDDELLHSTMKELQEQFPTQSFRSVGLDLSPGQKYLDTLIQATQDLDISIIFNNAGYIATGFFDSSSMDRQLANLECNVVASVKITHHFMQKMTQAGRKGCIVYTSSASAFIPSPFACMYGGTKAFLSQFASCLAIEGRSRGIDVLSVHPSPVATRFYDKTHRLDALDFAKLFAVQADVLPKEIIKSIGRVYWRDIGGFAICGRLLMSMASYNFWTTLFARTAHHMPDFKRNVAKKSS